MLVWNSWKALDTFLLKGGINNHILKTITMSETLLTTTTETPTEDISKKKTGKKKGPARKQSPSYGPEDKYRMSEFIGKYPHFSIGDTEFKALEGSLHVKKTTKALAASLRYMKTQLGYRAYQPETGVSIAPSLGNVLTPSATVRIPFKEYEVDLVNKELVFHL